MPTFRNKVSKEQVITIHLIACNPNSSNEQKQSEGPTSPVSSIRKRTGSVFNSGTKEGYLTKRGNSIQSWKRRWCVLHNNFIFYFRKKQVSKNSN